MKKIFTPIMLLITMANTNVMGMDIANISTNIITTERLLSNNGTLLRKLIDSEKIGFSQDLHNAETILKVFLTEISPNDIIKHYSRETLEQAQLISHRAQDRDKLFAMIEKEDNDIVLDNHIAINPYILTMYNCKQESLLHQAVSFERKKCVETLLKLKANPDCIDSNGSSVLHKAIKRNVRIDIINELLKAGADPDKIDNQGNTPFSLACSQHSPSVKAFEPYGYCFFSSLWPNQNPYELLKDNGAYLKELANGPIGSTEWRLASDALKKFFDHINKNKRDSYDQPIRKAIVNKHGFILNYASWQVCEELFGKKTLLYTKEILKERSKIEFNLLHFTKEGYHEDLRDLLGKHAVSHYLRYVMLTVCIYNKSDDCLLLCLNNGFSPNRFHKKISPLHYAVQCKNSQAITLLAQYNPDLVITNNKKQTPLDYAVTLGYTQCKNAMKNAIAKKYNTLSITQGHCGLTKHILKSGHCTECTTALNQQLIYHGLRTPCNTIDDFTKIITDLNS